jgi:DNA-binding beta-propeller fold protein YncE
VSTRTRSSVIPLLLLAVLAAAVWAPSAGAADRIYWTSFDSGTIQWANLDGSGGIHELNPGAATISPDGYGLGGAIDPIQGRYYWANQQQGRIDWASLDGSGGGDLATGSATIKGPSGVSVDPVGRRVYWANQSEGSISFANLDGSGGANLNTGTASVEDPIATTVFPAAGRIYWTNFGIFISKGSIASASTAGGSGQTLTVTGSGTVEYPFGLAIDAAANHLYWANDNPGTISSADLDGGNSSDIDRRGLEMSGTYGVAFDPEAGRVYTALFAGNALAYLNVNGGGGMELPVDLPKESGPNFPVLYLEPRPIAAPTLTEQGPPVPRFKRKRKRPSPLPKLIGSTLTCQDGGWKPDLVEARLYRAPTSVAFSWTRDGAEVPGAAGDVLSAGQVGQVGDYRCRVSAANAAGTTTQTSAPVAIFSTGKAKLNKKRGTAKLTVLLPAEPGRLALAAKGFRAVSKNASGRAVVLVKAKGARKKKLKRRGKLRAVLKLTYTPADGAPATLRRRITLKHG